MDNPSKPKSRRSLWILLSGALVTLVLLAIGYLFKTSGPIEVEAGNSQAKQSGIQFSRSYSHRSTGTSMMAVSDGSSMAQAYDFTTTPPGGAAMFLLNNKTNDFFFYWADDGSPGLDDLTMEEVGAYEPYPNFHREHAAYIEDQLVYFPDTIGKVELIRFNPSQVATTDLDNLIQRRQTSRFALEIVAMANILNPNQLSSSTVKWLESMALGNIKLEGYGIKQAAGKTQFAPIAAQADETTRLVSAAAARTLARRHLAIAGDPSSSQADRSESQAVIDKLLGSPGSSAGVLQEYKKNKLTPPSNPKQTEKLRASLQQLTDINEIFETLNTIKEQDIKIYTASVVDLLANANPRVRQIVYDRHFDSQYRADPSKQRESMPIWKMADPKQVINLYDSVTDPIIKKQIRDEALSRVAPEYYGKLKEIEFWDPNTKLTSDNAKAREFFRNAVQNGDVETLDKLLAKGYQFKTTSPSVLVLAVKSKSIPFLKRLLAKKWDQNCLDEALRTAIDSKLTEAINLIREQYLQSEDGSSLMLMKACATGDAELVRSVIDSVTSEKKRKEALASTASADVVQVFIDKGLSKAASTALLCSASQKGRFNIAKLLIDNGADPDGDGISNPLCFAAENNDLKLMKYLIDHGANINGLGEKSITPLQFAQNKKRQEAIQFLTDLGAK